jgi:small subunit ribosomal protein S16
MPVKIRLQRHGKKGKAFFHIVAADSRSPRDGKFIEKLGTYNPNTNPATIELSLEGAVKWLQNGAQPSDTCRAILSYKGAMMKNHLLNGVKKGALTQEQADNKFQQWVDEKGNKIVSKVDRLAADKKAAIEKQLALEKEQNEAKAKAIEAKYAVVEETPVAEEAPAAEEEAPAAEETSTEEKAAE